VASQVGIGDGDAMGAIWHGAGDGEANGPVGLGVGVAVPGP